MSITLILREIAFFFKKIFLPTALFCYGGSHIEVRNNQSRLYNKQECYEQVKNLKDFGKNSNQITLIRLNYQAHKQAIYTSRLLNYQNLSKL